MCNDNLDTIIDAGYNLALHFTLVRSKAVLDQFQEGLGALGVLNALKKFPFLLQPLFVTHCTRLSAGLL